MFATKISLKIKPVFHWETKLCQFSKEKFCIIFNKVCEMQNCLIHLDLCLDQPVEFLSTEEKLYWSPPHAQLGSPVRGVKCDLQN